MKKVLVFAIVASVMWISPPGVRATNYYVDATNGDNTNNNGQSEATAWKTLKYAESQLSDGDVVFVRGDTYHENFTIDIANVTFQNYPGESPVIDGNETLPGGEWGILVNITANGVTFDGFEVRESTGLGISLSGGDNIVVRNCTAHETFQQTLRVYRGADNALIENCDLHHGSKRRWYYENGHPEYITPWTPTVTTKTCANPTFRSCKIHDSYWEGIDIGNETIGATVEYCEIYGNPRLQLYLCCSGNSIVRYNLIYGTTNGNGPGIWVSNEEWCYDYGEGSGHKIYGNLVANTRYNFWIGGNRTRPTDKITAYNNTFVEATEYGVKVESGTNAGHVFKNNIIWQTDGQIANIPGGRVTCDYNLWSRIPDVDAQGPNDPTYALPQLAKTSGWNNLTGGELNGSDFTLQSTSPAIDEGTDLGSPYDQGLDPASTWPDNVFTLDQNNYGSGWEIGAYVFTGVVPDPYCGDGSCNGDETCESCPEDCGECSGLIPQDDWTLEYVTSEQPPNQIGEYAFDGDPATFWHSIWNTAVLPQEIQIDLGNTYDVSGFRYLPRTDGGNGNIAEYEFYVSSDGSDWGTPVATGTFGSGTEEKEVLFSSSKTGSYVRFNAISEQSGLDVIVVRELNVLGTSFSPDTESPSVPENLQATAVSSSQIDLSWSASTDNVGVVGYDIYCDGGYLDSTADTSYSDTGLDPDTTYSYTVLAYDAAGNESDESAPDSATTDSVPVTDPIDRTNWTVEVDSEDVPHDQLGIYAIDNNLISFWHTEWGVAYWPHYIQVDLDGTYNISGFKYLPRTDGGNGNIEDYKFYVSSNPSEWGAAVETGTFGPGTEEKTVLFSPETGSYVKLEVLSEQNGTYVTVVRDLNVLGEPATPPCEQLDRTDWIVTADSEELNTANPGPATDAVDGYTDEFWMTQWLGVPDPPHPHYIQIDLGDDYAICGFKYLPRQDNNKGRIKDYEFYVSASGTDWGTLSPVATGTFADTAAEQEVTFDGIAGVYIRLVAFSTFRVGDGENLTSVAELNVLGY
jgi:F5/8 type C domain/Fibronectin type III domain/Right handed beta helix region